jgi:hypothetical protein
MKEVDYTAYTIDYANFKKCLKTYYVKYSKPIKISLPGASTTADTFTKYTEKLGYSSPTTLLYQPM